MMKKTKTRRTKNKMTQIINLDRIANHFAGAILFDGRGVAAVIKSEGAFRFEHVSLTWKGDDVKYRFLHCAETKNFDMSCLVDKNQIAQELISTLNDLTTEDTLALLDYAKNLTTD